MTDPNYEPSYRLELMRLRERFGNARGSYRIIAALAGCVSLISVLTPDHEYRWVTAAVAALISTMSILAYRDVLNRPRFWALVPLVMVSVLLAFSILDPLVRGARGLLSGEFEWSGLLRELDIDVFALGFWILVTWNAWSRLPSREEAALIEEHREEWDSYAAGRSFRSKRTVKSEPSSEAASQS